MYCTLISPVFTPKNYLEVVALETAWRFESSQPHHFYLRDAARQPIARVLVRGKSSNLHHIYLREAGTPALCGDFGSRMISLKPRQ
ncbi:protein of unknown function [Hyphomicrobium sp. MC1]|nr:protein of unknown function [Hyphomicrobium sp. MC1]